METSKNQWWGRCNHENISTVLQNEIPKLSKTSAYNTLRILIEAGLVRVIMLVRVITTEDNGTIYDIDVQNHGHFKCKSCGTIYNFNVNIDSLNSADLKNFKINDKNIYLKGICPRCLSDINENK